MSTNGILVDTMWCTGCHTCEVGCQMLLGLPPDQYGIKLNQIGPYEYEPKKWEFLNIPTLSTQCDMCEERVSQGKKPMCVKHCQAKCLTFGPIEELIKAMGDKPYSILLTGPRA